MSDISGYLSQILNAVYGEQVRGAIVDAITQCYSDVNDPSLQTEAFSAAVEAAYENGFLDIQEKSTVAGMTNQSIIYRYTGNEAGYVPNALYYHNGTSWVPVGSGVRTATAASQMTDTSTIYMYTGSETGYKSNVLYYYNGTAWTPVSAEEYTTEDAPTGSSGNLFNKSTMLENKVITASGINTHNTYKLANIPVTAGKTYSAQMKSLAWGGTVGIAFTDSSDNMVYYATLASTIVNGYAVLNKPVGLKTVSGDVSNDFISRDVSEKGICFTVPTGITHVAIQVVTGTANSVDDFMIEEGQVCTAYTPNAGSSSGKEITTLYGYPLSDKYLRGSAVKKSDIGYYQNSGGKNIFDSTTMIIGGYQCNSGSFVATSNVAGSACALVPVVGGKTYSIQRKYASWQGNGAVCLLDSELNQLYGVQFTTDGTNGDYKYPLEYRMVSSQGQGEATASPDYANKGLRIVTSEDTAYLAFNYALSGATAMEVQVEEGSVCTAYEPYSAYGGTEISSLFGANLVDVVAREALGINDGEDSGGGSSGKKYSGIEWVSIGDSITVGGGGGGGYYANEVANDLGFTHINAAHSGVPFGAIMTQADQITDATKIVTVMLGTNNSAETDASIGQIGDTSTDTLHGTIYAGINKILTAHPSVILGVIVPVPRYRTASEHESVRKVAKAINEACEYYCIPHLDLHGQIGFAEQTADVYYQSDHLHPSAAGAHRMALAIEQWMESLLGDL